MVLLYVQLCYGSGSLFIPCTIPCDIVLTHTILGLRLNAYDYNLAIQHYAKCLFLEFLCLFLVIMKKSAPFTFILAMFP